MNEPNPDDLNPPKDSIGDSDFVTFAREKGYMQNTIEPAMGKSPVSFAIKRSGSFFSRDYYAFDPSGEFSHTAEAVVGGKSSVRLTKLGRTIQSDVDGRLTSEAESASFLRGKYVGYDLNTLKGELGLDSGVAGLSIKFDTKGEFMDFSSRNANFLESSRIDRESLENHFMQSKSPLVIIFDERTGIICEDNGDYYTVYLLGSGRNPHHKVIIQKHIEPQEDLIEELGIRSLMEDPMQPAHGMPGKSHGDDVWRYTNFPDKIGVHVVPTDTPEELEEFGKKEFGKLVSDIAKQV